MRVIHDLIIEPIPRDRVGEIFWEQVQQELLSAMAVPDEMLKKKDGRA